MYVLSDLEKFTRSTLRMLNFSEVKIGKSRELGMSLGIYASVCMCMPLFERAIRYHQKAIDIRKELKDEWGVAQCLQWLGFCYSWKGEYQKSIGAFQESKDKFQKMGDMWEIGMDSFGLGTGYLYRGDYSQVVTYFSQYVEISQKVGDDYGISIGGANLGSAYMEKGEFVKAESWIRQSLDLSAEKKIWYCHCIGNIYSGCLEIERDNYEKAIKYLQQAKKLYEENNFLKHYTVCLYPYLAESYIGRITAGGEGITNEEKKKIKTACREALKQTKAWPTHYGGALRITAKYYALIGKRRKANSYFLKSIEHAKKLGRRYELAKGYYEYGNFLQSTAKAAEAGYNRQQAYNLFKEIGAKVYIKRCGDLLGYQTEEGKEKTEEETPRGRLKTTMGMTTIIDTITHISSILNLDELLEKIMDTTIQLVGAERGLLLLYSEEGAEPRRLERRIARNVTAREIEQEAFSVSRSIIAKVEKQKEPLIIEDAALDEELKDEASVVRYGLRSVLCLPIMVREDMLGILYLDNRLIGGLFTRENLNILELIARQAGVSIENAILYKRSITDSLTGLYNRNFFENYLIKVLHQAHRYNHKLSLLMIDIDYFKKVNDQYGHQAGDLVLKSVCDILKENIRKSDLIARYGGEELVIVLPETDISGANAVGENIRQAIEQDKFSYEIKERKFALNVTVSIGAAELMPGEDTVELIKKSDRALYQAKSLGRNRVEVDSKSAKFKT